jgi:small subunit ribosomal protein S8
MMTDPIADLLTHLRNASLIGKKKVVMPASALKVNVAQVLKDEGFINGFSVESAKPQSRLVVDMKYGPDGQRVFRVIQRVSKPGCRVYGSPRKMPPVLRGLGIYILSTPRGLMSDRAARAANLGGEILAKVL